MKLPPFPGELVRYLVERPFTTKTARHSGQHGVRQQPQSMA